MRETTMKQYSKIFLEENIQKERCTYYIWHMMISKWHKGRREISSNALF